MLKKSTARRFLFRFVSVFVFCFLFPFPALADKQKPPENLVPLSDGCINDRCDIHLDHENAYRSRLTDGNRKNALPVKKNKGFVLTIPRGVLNSGLLYLEWFSAPDYTLSFYDADGTLLASAENPYKMLEQVYPLPDDCETVTLKAKSDGKISGVYVYANENDAPESVQYWQAPDVKTDLLLVSAHSDDELVMMGGILPTYAGERGLRVHVAYMSARESQRRYEALAGLKVSHITRYPSFLGVYDKDSRKDAVKALVRLIRQIQPEVIVTHDLKGEYGAEAHIKTAKAVITAFERAADGSYDIESVNEYGVWQAKKLYLHLWPENTVSLDFDTPLSSFGGKTALEVTVESFSRHQSQRVEWLQTLLDNTYDCRKYGLYATFVGPDVEKNDLFEHINLSGTQPAL